MSRWVDLGALSRFAVVGSLTVGLDAAAYVLLQIFGGGVDLAKGLSFVVGALFAYVANWRFTFGQRRSRWSELLFALVYACALGINVLVNALVGGLLDARGGVVAFVLATGASAAWNFLGMSLFVFSGKEPSRARTAGR